jgi:hypothetical protein
MWENPADWLEEPAAPVSADQSEAPPLDMDRPGQAASAVPVPAAAQMEETADQREGENAPIDRPDTSNGRSDASRRHSLDISLLARHIGKIRRISFTVKFFSSQMISLAKKEILFKVVPVVKLDKPLFFLSLLD